MYNHVLATSMATCKATLYALSCGKNIGTRTFTRTVTTYTCSTCGTSATYRSVGSARCAICGGTHSIGASGGTTVTHTR